MSLARLEEHRRRWAAKPELARIYAAWFDRLLDFVPQEGRALEVGAGPGFFSEHARRRRPGVVWIASDVVAAPWNELAADAQRLPLRSSVFDAVLGLDVIHHLARPGVFLLEAARVLSPGGRLALIEPWITPLSYPIYRFLHQETCTLSIDPWDPFPQKGDAEKEAFDGDAAIPWRAVRQGRWERFDLEPPRVVLLNTFAYLLSLGFKPRSLLPRSWVDPLIALDRRTASLARVLGMRALIVWRKPGDQ